MCVCGGGGGGMGVGRGNTLELPATKYIFVINSKCKDDFIPVRKAPAVFMVHYVSKTTRGYGLYLEVIQMYLMGK